MMRIDAHQHFWNYDPVEYSWMTDEMSSVKQNFQPEELYPHLVAHDIDGTVLVQVTQTEEETALLLSIAAQHEFVKGVVGWVDLCSPDIRKKLISYAAYPKLKGFRHILQSEDPSFMLQPDFISGVAALQDFDFTYDILIYPKHLNAAVAFAKHFPLQRLVVDHIAKPYIKTGDIGDWERGIRLLASQKNIYCKISGMVTEADWKTWRQDDFIPYIDTVVDAFGTGRIMFGSDWPMCLVAGTYDEVIKIVSDYFSTFPEYDQQMFFGGNAIEFYNLK